MKKQKFIISQKNEKLLMFIADKSFNGHFTLLSFTTEYKFAFGTVTEREEIENLIGYDNINDAIENAIQKYLITT